MVDRKINDELLNVLTNILAAEEHLLEEKKLDLNKLKSTRIIRDKLILLIFKDNKNIFAKWCILKHLLLSYEHMLESVPKEDNEHLKVALKDIANQIKELIYSVLFDIKNGKHEECNKCKSDLVRIYASIKKIIGGN